MNGQKRGRRRGVVATALGTLTACLVAASAAGAPGDTIVTASQVENINTGGLGSFSSNPQGFAVIGSTAFFRATDVNGNELWKSDPPYTEATTTMVDDFNASGDSNPNLLTAVGDTLFFRATADSGTTGSELYKSVPPYDAASTGIVADIFTGADNSSDPEGLVNFNGTLFFRANDGTNGFELWRSDGGPLGPLPNGTEMVKNIFPGGTSSFPSSLTKVGGTLFFGADDGTNGFELWKSNGGTMPSDTVMVANINTGNPPGSSVIDSSDVIDLAEFNGTLFFAASDGINGRELWKSDGGPLGPGDTEMVANINTGDPPGSSPGNAGNPSQLTSVNSTLFFSAHDGINGNELWKSNGGTTPGDTQMVTDIFAGAGNGSDPSFLTNVSGTLFFQADDGSDPGFHGSELWKTTGGGATLVADIQPGTMSSSPMNLANVGGTLLFSANEGSSGQELWQSSGSAADTKRAADINVGGDGSSPNNLTNVNGTLLFSANPGPSTGRELWRATLSVEPFPPTVTPPALTPTTPAAQKKCKKGQKLRKGKCVKKKRKRRK